MSQIKKGFLPVFYNDSKVLILGSFPSVKSREVEFYYGNLRNKFWRILCSYFNEEIPQTLQGKKEFLKNNKIALWDVVTECEIIGSQDSTIKNYKVADLNLILQNCSIELIILNGNTAFNIFKKHYADINIPYIKLPSTSPANFKCDEGEWENALRRVFKRA
ncbi:MAG: DNA-deoxyinosine glycosylase [Clostridiales bacterium]|nr:DNA-deoxyinosine glycosylase [Clostridiales bacterium]